MKQCSCELCCKARADAEAPCSPGLCRQYERLIAELERAVEFERRLRERARLENLQLKHTLEQIRAVAGGCR